MTEELLPDTAEPEFSREERLAFCRAVANMIGADRIHTEDEKIYLMGLVRQTGLSMLDDDVQQAIDAELTNPSPIESIVSAINNPELKRTLYRTLVEVALCDQHLSPEELERLVTTSSVFNLNSEAARELVQWTQDSIALDQRERNILARL